MLLAHIGAWDERHARELLAVTPERLGELPETDTDAFNQAMADRHRDWSLDQALAFLASARRTWWSAIEELPEQGWRDERSRGRVERLADLRYIHDMGHADDIVRWRNRLGRREIQAGPKTLYQAALLACREEFMTTMSRVPSGERASRAVCGEWSLKHVVSHLADWDRVCAVMLRNAALGVVPADGFKTGIEEFNQQSYQHWRNEPWEHALAELQAARRDLLAALDALPADLLTLSYPASWDLGAQVHGWLRIWVGHDREHAAGIRAALDLPVPARLRRFHYRFA